MQLHDFPKSFWLVTSPSTTSTLADICFESDLRRFAVQIRGGLEEEKIVAVFVEQPPAVELAKEMLLKVEEFRQTPGLRIHKSPWPDWFATQESLEGVMICNKAASEKVVIEPPKEWDRQWAWNFTEDGSGIVIRQTAWAATDVSRKKGISQMGFAILTDAEFLAMVAHQEQPAELNQALLEMRREGKIQIFNDDSGDPLIIKLEQTN